MTELSLSPDNQNADSPERERVYLHSYRSGVWLPLLQASVTGGLIGLAVGLLALLAGIQNPAAWGGLAWVSVQTAAWFMLLWRWLALTRPVETIIRQDLDGDGHIGEPRQVRVIVESDDRRHVEFIDLPASQEQLGRLAVGLLAGHSLSESAWTGAGGPFSRREFQHLRDELIRRGLVSWVNPSARAQGVELTKPGRAVMRRIAALSASPTPPDNRPRIHH